MSDSDESQLAPTLRVPKFLIRHGVSQQRGQRQSMEDTHFISERFHEFVREVRSLSMPSSSSLEFPSPASYFGLFDGHAGRAAAEFCEHYLHRNIALNVNHSSNLCEAMAKGFVQTDEEFIDQARISDEESGSVAVSLIISESHIHVAHAGDARAVLCRAGKAILLTHDHKPTLTNEKARVEQSGGTVEYDMLNGFLEVSRAFGDFDRDLQSKTRGLTALPDTDMFELTDEDEFVIVACDGLWDVFESDVAVEFARECLRKFNNDLQKVCEQMVQEALRRHSDDNITVMIIGFARALPLIETEAETVQEAALPVTPTSSSLAQRPRFCISGLVNLKDLLHR